MPYFEDDSGGYQPNRRNLNRRPGGDFDGSGGFKPRQKHVAPTRGARPDERGHRNPHEKGPFEHSPVMERQNSGYHHPRSDDDGRGQLPGMRPGFWVNDWSVDLSSWTATHIGSGVKSILENRDDGSMTVTITGHNNLSPEEFHIAKIMGECIRIWQRPPRRTPR